MNKKEKMYFDFERKAFPSMDVLYSFALRMTGNKKNALKLLKMVYGKAFWFFPHLDERIDVSGWLFRIIRNTFINDFKKESPALRYDYENAENFFKKIKSSDPDLNKTEEEINSKITETKLSDLVLNLPDDFRFVIILCDIHKMTYEEIADFVDVPVGVVITRLIKARKILFTELFKLYGKR